MDRVDRGHTKSLFDLVRSEHAFNFSGTIVSTMEKTVNTLEEFEKEAIRFAATIMPHAPRATFVTLSGELGAGKTAFAKVIAATLGVTSTVTSPTFVLEKIYPLPQGGRFKRLIHIDAYRLTSGADLTPLHFTEYMKDEGNLIMLEWPEKVAEILPKPVTSISFKARADGSRIITYD